MVQLKAGWAGKEIPEQILEVCRLIAQQPLMWRETAFGDSAKIMNIMNVRRLLWWCIASCLAASSNVGISQTPNLPPMVKLRDAAEAGDAAAQEELAVANYKERRYSTALQWYQKAAAQGRIESIFALADLYSSGKKPIPGRTEAIPKDAARALKYMLTAANMGHPHAQEVLGLWCLDGIGVRKDEVEAYKWFRLASRTRPGTENAYLRPLTLRLSRDQIAEGERRAGAFRTTTSSPIGDLILGELRLKAVVMSGTNRVALINDQAFKEGEEAELDIMGERVRIKCVKITAKGASIAVDGKVLPRELTVSE